MNRDESQHVTPAGISASCGCSAPVDAVGKGIENITMTGKPFEPVLVAFCCNFCAYASADLAGSLRIQYPSNVRIIRTTCTGRLEVEYFMKAFEHGADGVLVAGCLEGGCHFIEGNLWAKRRVNATRNLLAEIGLEPERLRMVNISAAMARPLADILTDMVETVRALGPSKLKNNPPHSMETRS
jgi:F420-non-reducing hydrogenase iron-sulfur subunit